MRKQCVPGAPPFFARPGMRLTGSQSSFGAYQRGRSVQQFQTFHSSIVLALPDIILYGNRVKTRRLGPYCACVEWYGTCITSYLHYTAYVIFTLFCACVGVCAIHITSYLRCTAHVQTFVRYTLDGTVCMVVRSCLWSNGQGLVLELGLGLGSGDVSFLFFPHSFFFLPPSIVMNTIVLHGIIKNNKKRMKRIP